MKLGETYRLYGKMGGMKHMKPVHNDAFVTNLMHADLYVPTTEDEITRMEHELLFLADQGQFEFRPVDMN